MAATLTLTVDADGILDTIRSGVEQLARDEYDNTNWVLEIESTSRLRAENEALRAKCEALEQLLMAAGAELAQVNNKATVREVAEELRVLAKERVGLAYLAALADRLDPPPVVEKPPA